MSDFKPLEELVERSQRIGNDQSLVVFGGGNTSSKGEISDHYGRRKKVLWVKGSGADMQYGVDRDYPGLYLDELLKLQDFSEMSDDKNGLKASLGADGVHPNEKGYEIMKRVLLNTIGPSFK